MSRLAEQIADELAAEAIEIADALKDDAIVSRITKALADQSQTLEEAFTVSVRVQRAANRARALLAEARGGLPAPKAPDDAG